MTVIDAVDNFSACASLIKDFLLDCIFTLDKVHIFDGGVSLADVFWGSLVLSVIVKFMLPFLRGSDINVFDPETSDTIDHMSANFADTEVIRGYFVRRRRY